MIIDDGQVCVFIIVLVVIIFVVHFILNLPGIGIGSLIVRDFHLCRRWFAMRRRFVRGS